jgi:DNA-binding transcriptional MerR regulator
MKNWLTIGQFSKKIGVSSKALRLYEKIGLITSHTRGENGYRYYDFLYGQLWYS